MAEKSTIARPYAQAAFEVAHAAMQLKEWSAMLSLVAAVAADKGVTRLIDNTNVKRDQLAQLFIDICGDKLSEKGRNFVRLLAENRRLAVLPQIAEQYEVLRAEAEKTITAEVVSAFALDATQQKKLADKLAARLGRQVSLACTVDETLLGGAIIKAGDLVIDGSVTGKLNKLSAGLA